MSKKLQIAELKNQVASLQRQVNRLSEWVAASPDRRKDLEAEWRLIDETAHGLTKALDDAINYGSNQPSPRVFQGLIPDRDLPF